MQDAARSIHSAVHLYGYSGVQGHVDSWVDVHEPAVQEGLLHYAASLCVSIRPWPFNGCPATHMPQMSTIAVLTEYAALP